ncbi:MAG: DUF262 domain-containing protein [Firmicutes bacterium]|nr:DUF262 domain-containing protein [Bacillota bacterium]
MEHALNIYPKIEFEPVSARSIGNILEQIEAAERKFGIERLDLQPSYQRGEAWENEFKEKLIYSLVTHYPIGNFVVRKVDPKNTDEPTAEVVDGQQRLRTIREFIKNGMELSPNNTRHIVRENRDAYEYDKKYNMNETGQKLYQKFLKDEKKSNVKLTFASLPSTIQKRILEHNLNIIAVRCDKESISQYFRFIQNQERLRAGEIINSIPDSPARDYLEQVDNKDGFLKIVGWDESRKEFDKIFYSMIGIFENKLLLGTTDKAIIDYISGFQRLSATGVECVNKMVAAINHIANLQMDGRVRFNKRLIKFIFLLAGLGHIDFTQETATKLKKLCQINEDIVWFNKETTEELERRFGTRESMEQHREIFFLGRGSHAKKVMEKRIAILSRLITLT